MKKLLLLSVLSFMAITAILAQTKITDTTIVVKNTTSAPTAAKINQSVFVQMDDTLRSSGKIYVVIITIAIVFIGLAIYLFSIDRRLKKLEK
jgi:CcmD family protein